MIIEGMGYDIPHGGACGREIRSYSCASPLKVGIQRAEAGVTAGGEAHAVGERGGRRDQRPARAAAPDLCATHSIAGV